MTPLCQQLDGETHFRGMKKGRPGWNALWRHLIGILRYVNSVPRVIKMGEACFLTKTSLFLFPVVEISGIEPLTS